MGQHYYEERNVEGVAVAYSIQTSPSVARASLQWAALLALVRKEGSQ